jgi:hypothetical protein
MSDGERERDAAWLLARERGEPGPEMSEERAERYAQLEALVADLPTMPAMVVPLPGWRQRAVAAINAAAQNDPGGSPTVATIEAAVSPARARTKRPRWVTPAAAAAMAAVLAIVVITRGWPREPDRPRLPLVAITVEAGGSNRSAQPNVGDTLVVRTLAPGGGELRVYDEAGTEQARCGEPGPGCRTEQSRDGITLVLTMPVRKPDSFRVVLLSSSLAGPSAGLDADVAAAVRAGITVSTQNPIRFR